MKDIIARLRELEAAALTGDPKLLGETTASLEFINLLVDNSAKLLDRLEKLEAVAEAAEEVVESSITQADILADGSIAPTKCSVDPEEFDKLQDALAALEDEK
jgi:hypothetical protein